MNKDIKEKIERAKKTGVLDLSFRSLSKLPSEIAQLHNLTTLHLSGNQLSELPTDFNQLHNLTTLHLSYNQLSKLPTDFNQLHNLATLHLTNNQLSELPTDFNQLHNLTRLNFRYNQISKLPNDFFRLGKLEQVDISQNQLTEIPADITPTPNLTQLDLSGNKIASLPTDITRLDLPILWKASGSWDEKGVFLKGNPLESPPVEIVKQGAAAVRAYFQAPETRPLNEVKVLLIGDGGAGKTSLLKKLLGKRFDPKESKTHGVNIDDLTMDKAGQPLRVRLWDFGGQEIMHATHQFFLSARSLYLVVLDGRRDQRPEYWLKHARTFGGDSPVFVALNKIDEHAHDIERSFLRERYPAIRGFFPISCAKGTGLEELKQALEDTLGTLEMATTRWPETWFRVKKNLEEDKRRPYLSQTEFKEVCRQCGEDDPASHKVLVRFLNDLGVAIHFDEFRLKHTFVLEPKWATAAVYRVINSETLAQDKGVLTTKAFAALLAQRGKGKHDGFRYPESVHAYILDLMRKFELCYELSDERILVPDLLPVSEPEQLSFDLKGALKFRVSYDFLPRTVMPRLIVRQHREIEGDLRWRNGVALRKRKLRSRALLRADYENRAILGWISGGAVHQYLVTLLDAIDDINRGFQENKIEEEVACVCDACRSDAEPEFHPLYTLLDFYLKGSRDWPCRRENTMVPIAQVLGHALTGEAAGLERLLDEVNQLKHELTAMKPGQLKKRLENMASAASISGTPGAWLIDHLLRLLGGG